MLDPKKNYKLMSVNSGKVADVRGDSEDDWANLIQFDWHKGTNQKWVFEEFNRFYQIKSVNSGKVIDIQGGSTKEGAKIIQYPDNGGQNQQWFIVEVN
jgi:hypothetical protein